MRNGVPLRGEYAPGRAKSARRQAELFEASSGAEAGDIGGYPIVVLTSVGARTGKLRKTALMRVERGGVYLLLASPHTSPRRPDWYYNLMANPAAELQDGAVRREYRAREVHGVERDGWWELALEAYPLFARFRPSGRTQSRSWSSSGHPLPQRARPAVRVGLRSDVCPELLSGIEASLLNEPKAKGRVELGPERRSRSEHDRMDHELVLVHEAATD